MTKKPKSALEMMSKMNFDKFKDLKRPEPEPKAAPPTPSKPATPASRVDVATKKILIVDPQRTREWAYCDRPDNEFGDLDGLAHEFKDAEIGQKQPCVARAVTDDPNIDFEIVAGRRRRRAAILATTTLMIVVEELDDHQAAMTQIAENFNRENLSDYAIGMSYARLLAKGLLKQKDLESKFNINAVKINRFVAFSKLPTEIVDAIGDMTKVSARTAAEIRAYLKKGDAYKAAILSLADRLATGKLGANRLRQEIDKVLNKDQKSAASAEEIKSKSGRHLFTWRRDSNGNTSISFPKDIRTRLDREKVESVLSETILSQLDENEQS